MIAWKQEPNLQKTAHTQSQWYFGIGIKKASGFEFQFIKMKFGKGCRFFAESNAIEFHHKTPVKRAEAETPLQFLPFAFQKTELWEGSKFPAIISGGNGRADFSAKNLHQQVLQFWNEAQPKTPIARPGKSPDSVARLLCITQCKDSIRFPKKTKRRAV